MKEPLMQEGKFRINGSYIIRKIFLGKGYDPLTEYFMLK